MLIRIPLKKWAGFVLEEDFRGKKAMSKIFEMGMTPLTGLEAKYEVAIRCQEGRVV